MFITVTVLPRRRRWCIHLACQQRTAYSPSLERSQCVHHLISGSSLSFSGLYTNERIGLIQACMHHLTVSRQMNLEDFQGVPLREWIAQDATRREIKRRFQSFLLSFQVW